jgi:ABC-type nitrate/sulfonate/bicarbonate transport system substrate-binding protein
MLQKTGIGVAVATGLAGCSGGGDGDGGDGGDGGGGTQEPSDGGGGSDSTPEPTPEPLEELQIAHPAAPESSGVNVWLGLREIAPQDYGLSATIKSFDNTSLATQATLAGEADIARGTITRVGQLAQQDRPFSAIVCMAKSTDYVLVSQPNITSLEQIVDEDAVIGMNAPSSIDIVQTATIMKQEGLIDSVDDLNLQQIGFSSARQTAMLSGDIDVSAQHYSQWLVMQEENPDLNLLTEFGNALPEWIQEVYYAPDTAIEENPEEMAAFCKSIVAGNRAMYEMDFSEYQSLVKRYVPGGGPNEEILRESFSFLQDINFWPPNGDLRTENVQFMVDNATDLGLLEGSLSQEDVLNRDPLDQALEDMGTEPNPYE